MLTIELEPEVEITLCNIAQQEHLSLNETIKQLVNFYIKQQQESTLLIDIAKDFPVISCFANQDPLEIQQALRDEWH